MPDRNSKGPAGNQVGPAENQVGPAEVNIVMVEDDAIVRSWIQLSLRRTEFRIVAEAGTAADARELVHYLPDLWLVDYHLPDQLGTVLLRELRQDGVTAPAVVVTAGVMHGFNELVRQSGGQGTVLKTGSPSEVIGALRAVVAGRPSFDVRHPTEPAARESSRRESARCSDWSGQARRMPRSPRSSASARRP